MTQPVKFGLNVDPNTGGLPIAERITAIADASGLDLVGVQDHPYNDGFTDTLTLITWLAGRTRHVHLFPNVANLPLRAPTGSPGWAVLAAAPGRPATRSARPSTSSAAAGPGNPTATRAPTIKYQASGRVPGPRTTSGCGLASSVRARSSSWAPEPTAGQYRRPTCRQTGCPSSTRSSPAPPSTPAVTPPRSPACTTSWA